VITISRHPTIWSLRVACPFFMPQQKLENGSWPHPSRLPLGGGWTGYCTAPGHAGDVPESLLLENGCNLGYASGCSRLPLDRRWDSVRFQVTRTGERRLIVAYACERDHRPASYGTLEYDLPSATWITAHEDIRIRKMAECYIESHLLRKSVSSSTEIERAL
jgi:hypothetical protein